MKPIFVLLCGTLLLGCATHRLNASNLELQEMRLFRLGVASPSDVFSKFGEPFKHLRETSSGDEVLIYLNERKPPSTRAAFAFDGRTKRLTAKTWYFTEKEKNRDLEEAKKEFLGPRVKVVPEPWTEHFGPDGIFYRDEDSPVQLVYSKMQKAVESVEWREKGFESIRRQPAHYVEVR